MSPYLFKSNFFKSRNDHKLSSTKPDTLFWSYLGSHLELSPEDFDLKGFVPTNINKSPF